jgi:hypothetical protein
MAVPPEIVDVGVTTAVVVVAPTDDNVRITPFEWLLPPTAKQSVALGHAMPLRLETPTGVVWSDQFLPESPVDKIVPLATAAKQMAVLGQAMPSGLPSADGNVPVVQVVPESVVVSVKPSNETASQVEMLGQAMPSTSCSAGCAVPVAVMVYGVIQVVVGPMMTPRKTPSE